MSGRRGAEAGSPPIVEVRSLGAAEVLVGGVHSGFFDSRKLLFMLLLVLAVERERSRDALMGLFWPDRPSDRARRSLNQALYELRQELGDHWLRTPGDSVRVNGFLQCDLPDFESALADGRSERALELFGGSLLKGFSIRGAEIGQWASGKRALVDRLARAMFKEEVDVRLSRGGLEGAVQVARRWVELDPYDDEGQHRLIELLAASGDRVGALRRYDLYRALLLEDDLRPLDGTVALVEAVRAGQTPDLGLPESRTDAGSAGGGPTLPQSDRTPADSPSPRGLIPDPSHSSSGNSPTGTGTVRWVAGAIPSGPKLRRILPDGRPGEALLLGQSKTVLGREVGDLTFPDDATLATSHAVIMVRNPPSGDDGAKPRYFLRPAEPGAEVFVRIRGSWPVRPGDRLAAGGLRIRVLR